MRSLQLKLLRYAATITNGLSHFYYVGATGDGEPSSAGLAPFLPPDPSPKRSLVATGVMKHRAMSGHALGTHSALCWAGSPPRGPVAPAGGPAIQLHPDTAHPQGEGSVPQDPHPRKLQMPIATCACDQLAVNQRFPRPAPRVQWVC